MHVRSRRRWILSMFLAGLAACGGGGGDDGPDAGGPSGFDVDLTLRATNGAQNSSFAFGNSIAFTITITNRSGATQVLTLPTTQIYDLAVLEVGSSTPRWRWSFNQVFSPTESSYSFAGHQEITYLYLWNGVLEDGTQLMPGTYDVRGTLAYPQYSSDWRANHTLAAPIRRITITP